MTFPQRFMAKVNITETHWLWTGSTRPSGSNPKGHGMIQRREGINCKIYAHRASWILFKGPIPDGMKILHRCPQGHVPSCVNPDHLKVGDQCENMQDMTDAGDCYFASHSFIGEDHGMSTLTWEKVSEMRTLHATGDYVLRELSALFHVSIGQCSKIVRNESWVAEPEFHDPM